MRTTLLKVVSAFLICAAFTACGKGGGGNNNNNEATLTVTTNPANGSTQAAAPGPTFPLTVTVTSTMPAKGVTITVTAAPDGQAGSPFFTPAAVNTSQATTNFTITNTPSQTTCLVTVTVTSNDKSSNVWTGTYRYSMK